MAAKSKFDCLGLAKEWEANLQLRERIRDEKIVLKKEVGEPFVVPTRANAVSNSIVLLPLLERLSNTQKWVLPHLDDLEIEVRTLCEKCGLNPGEKGPYQMANEIKKMMVMIKRKARRQEVTKDNVVYFQKKHIWYLGGIQLMFSMLIIYNMLYIPMFSIGSPHVAHVDMYVLDHGTCKSLRGPSCCPDRTQDSMTYFCAWTLLSRRGLLTYHIDFGFNGNPKSHQKYNMICVPSLYLPESFIHQCLPIEGCHHCLLGILQA